MAWWPKEIRTQASAPIKESEYDRSKENACRKFRGGGVVSPDNPVEIQTVEISKFVSCGHNLFDPSQANAGGTINGITLTNNGDGTFDLNGTASDTAFFKLLTVSKSGTYHFYGLETNVGGSVRIDVRDESLSNMAGNEHDTGGKIPITFVVANQPSVLTIRIEKGYTANNLSIKPMLYQEGNGEYEPFIGKSITAELSLYSLPDGTCDEVIGDKLIRRVAHAHIDENTRIDYQSEAGGRFRCSSFPSIEGTDLDAPALCNRLKPHSSPVLYGNVDNTIRGYYQGDSVYIKMSRFSTATDFKSWLATHPIDYFYKMRTPTVTPIIDLIIPTQAPYTTISHDSPVETEVEYEILTKSDYTADIIDIKQRLAALENAAIE